MFPGWRCGEDTHIFTGSSRLNGINWSWGCYCFSIIGSIRKWKLGKPDWPMHNGCLQSIWASLNRLIEMCFQKSGFELAGFTSILEDHIRERNFICSGSIRIPVQCGFVVAHYMPENAVGSSFVRVFRRENGIKVLWMPRALLLLKMSAPKNSKLA